LGRAASSTPAVNLALCLKDVAETPFDRRSRRHGHAHLHHKERICEKDEIVSVAEAG